MFSLHKEFKRVISILGYNPDIVILDPHKIKDILTNIEQIPKKVDKVNEGQKLIKDIHNVIIFVNKYS